MRDLNYFKKENTPSEGADIQYLDGLRDKKLPFLKYAWISLSHLKVLETKYFFKKGKIFWYLFLNSTFFPFVFLSQYFFNMKCGHCT
jgi:hypothetical protein